MLNTGYLILGLKQNASPQEVKQVYKSLVLTFHPDKNPNNYLANEKFKLIQRAYQIVLADSKYRASHLQKIGTNKTPNLPRVCRRIKRSSRSDRKFNWQSPDEYIGTNIQLIA